LLRTTTVADLAAMFPERFSNKTNGVTPRRWLLQANPDLASLLTEAIGDGWITDLDQLKRILPLADDSGFRAKFLGAKRAAKARMGQMPLGGLNDSHAMFAEDGETQTVRRPERHLTRLQAMAMDTMQLAHNATLIEIKARYKELVKRFHPDANGGDRGAEERLKQVIKAYGVLRASGLLT